MAGNRSTWALVLVVTAIASATALEIHKSHQKHHRQPQGLEVDPYHKQHSQNGAKAGHRLKAHNTGGAVSHNTGGAVSHNTGGAVSHNTGGAASGRPSRAHATAGSDESGGGSGGGEQICKPKACEPKKDIFFGDQTYEKCKESGSDFAKVDGDKLVIDTSKCEGAKYAFGTHDKEKAKEYSDAVDIDGEFAFVHCNGDKQQLVITTKTKELKHSAKVDEKPLNVIVAGLDAVSRLCFTTSMPETIKAMKSMESHEAFDFELLSTVDGASFGNQGALFSGCMGVDSLKNNCGDHWIFNVAHQSGYAASYAEEYCPDPDNTIQDHFKENGGRSGPDHDLTDLFCKGSEFKSLYGEDKPFCLDGKQAEEHIFQQVKNVFNIYHDNPKLSVFNLLDGHDPPNCSRIKRTDPSLAKFFKSIGNGEFNGTEDTIVVLYSDHGNQYGQIYADRCGYEHHHRPLLYILYPKKHLGEINGGSVLKSNQPRFVSMYDVYTTISGIMDKKRAHSRVPPKGLDLIRQPVPLDRNCASANITLRFCNCIEWKEKTADEARDKVQKCVDRLNELNKQGDGDICAEMKLDKVETYTEAKEPGSNRQAMRMIFTVDVGEKFSAYVESEGSEVKGSDCVLTRITKYKPDQDACQPKQHGKEDFACVCKSRLNSRGGSEGATGSSNKRRFHVRGAKDKKHDEAEVAVGLEGGSDWRELNEQLMNQMSQY